MNVWTARRTTTLGLVVASLVALGIPGAGAAQAAGTTVSEAVIMAGDLFGPDPSYDLFREGTSTIAVDPYGPTGAVVRIRRAGSAFDDYQVALVPPQGQSLAVGSYTAYPGDFTAAQVNLVLGSSSFGHTEGGFVIRDIATDGAGTVTRLWATFESYSANVTPPLFSGELKFDEPVSDTDLVVGNSAVNFPGTYPGLTSRATPVVLVNTSASPMHVTATAVTGADAAAFAVKSSTCSSPVAVGASCVIRVAFSPRSVGQATAELDITDTTPTGSHTVALGGVGLPGSSGMFLRSQPGDYAGGGGHYDYTPVDSDFQVSGDPHALTMERVHGSVGYTASVRLAAPDGQTLTSGTTYLANGSGGTSATLDATVTGGCSVTSGSFTIDELEVAHGAVAKLAARFVQHCDGSAATLSGWISYRATNPEAPVEIRPTAPTSSARNAPLTIAGTLLFGITPIPGRTISVSRKDLSGTKALAPIVTDSHGIARIADTPRVGGPVTYSLTFAGDGTYPSATRSVVVQVSRLRTVLTTALAPRVTAYGGTAVVTVRLGRTGGSRVVSIWKYVYGAAGARYTLLKNVSVPASGTYVLRLRITRHVAIRATYAGDAVYAPAAATSAPTARAKVSLRLVGGYRTTGGVRLYHVRTNPVFVASILPARGTAGTAYFVAQVKVGSAWRTFAATDALTLDATSTVYAALGGKHTQGLNIRVQAVSVASTITTTGFSPWAYLKFTA